MGLCLSMLGGHLCNENTRIVKLAIIQSRKYVNIGLYYLVQYDHIWHAITTKGIEMLGLVNRCSLQNMM